SVTRPIWSPDGERLYVLVSDSGSTHIHSVPASGGQVTQVTTGARRISALSLSADGKRLAYVAGDATNPGDVFVANADGSRERQLTSLNAEFLGSLELSQPEEFTVPSQADGHPIH